MNNINIINVYNFGGAPELPVQRPKNNLSMQQSGEDYLINLVMANFLDTLMQGGYQNATQSLMQPNYTTNSTLPNNYSLGSLPQSNYTLPSTYTTKQDTYQSKEK